MTEATWTTFPGPIPTSPFKIDMTKEAITFGPLTAPVSIWEVHESSIGVFARPDGMNLQIVLDPATGKGTWTLSGIPGQGSGTLQVVAAK